MQYFKRIMLDVDPCVSQKYNYALVAYCTNILFRKDQLTNNKSNWQWKSTLGELYFTVNNLLY